MTAAGPVRRLLLSLPLFVVLTGIGGLAMLLPAVHAAALEDWAVARAFLHWGLAILLLSVLAGFATAPWRPSRLARSRLVTLLAAFILLPALLALPFWQAVPSASLADSYFEMVSSLTTTGATLFDDPAVLRPSLHFWRALVGWMGGFFIWVAAIAIFQPLNIGGFEVLSGALRADARDLNQITRVADPAERMARFSAALFPVYLGLTVILWIGLILTGDSALTALCHAMSTLSTSGISPETGGIAGAPSGRAGEVLVCMFLVFALSRRTFAGADQGGGIGQTFADPEFRLGLLIVLGLAMLLFLRHWFGAYEEDEQNDLRGALRGLWGMIFSTASFLTTTGFVSADWLSSRSWSGLETPGVILMGLAIFGGGVATTAGGVKLLRVYALWRHGRHELERLVEPHAVAGGGPMVRHLRGQGAQVSWVFFMLFALSIGVTMLGLTLTGLPLDRAIIFSVAALSTAGQVAQVAAEVPLSYATDLGEGARMLLCGAMVLGRVETLAIIALLNPEFWRR